MFTGRLGTALSYPANVELAFVPPLPRPNYPSPLGVVRVPIAGVPWASYFVPLPVPFSPAVGSVPSPDRWPNPTRFPLNHPLARSVPWVQFRPPPVPQTFKPPPAPGAPGSAVPPPVYTLRVPGVPWLPHPVPLQLDVPPPPPAPPPPAWLAMSRGVPINAPWAVPPALFPPAPPPHVTPPRPPPTKGVPLLLRVPDPTDPEGLRRLGRFSEMLSQIVNSLTQQGILVQTGPASWRIVGAGPGGGGGGLTGTFP